ncbi:MAG: hypothetical protein QOE54_5445 [Streptosporangiaceae bacterium]|jgi:hypothetical protein|nr:hypothetical protein [Streptosporangiaceae bacterium]
MSWVGVLSDSGIDLADGSDQVSVAEDGVKVELQVRSGPVNALNGLFYGAWTNDLGVGMATRPPTSRVTRPRNGHTLGTVTGQHGHRAAPSQGSTVTGQHGHTLARSHTGQDGHAQARSTRHGSTVTHGRTAMDSFRRRLHLPLGGQGGVGYL